MDTYFDGDGARGRRSRALGIGELYKRLGYADWFKPGEECELLAAMCARLGDDRVLFSALASTPFNLEFPYMDPAPVQRGLERDDMIPVASVYPASVNGAW